MNNFTEVLDDLMKEKNLNATQLAQYLGCTKTTICRYKKGTRFPSLFSFIRIADFFKCPTDFLYGIVDDYNHLQTYKTCPPFSERIRFLLDYLKVTKKQFCIQTNISETSFFLWLDNNGNPTVENIHKIAETFDLTIDFVLGREN